MDVRIRLFGAAREAAGAKELALTLPEGARVSDVKQRLARDLPALVPLFRRVAVSRNRAIVTDDAALADGDEIALLPPVSGGAGAAAEPGRCRVSEAPLDVSAVVARVAGPGMGGIVTFVGTVRDAARGRAIRRLEYEAYPEMAEQEMQRIAQEAAERFPGARVAMDHRAGALDVGEIAVVVVAAAPHRAEAFDACRYAIDTLKQRVPIWKKEIATDGEYWVDDHA
jgi:molybdopterin synthase catalytic subunit